MRPAHFFIFFLLICSFAEVSAQMPKTPDGFKQPRILILMDGSSSMLSQWDNKIPRFKAAARLVSAVMDSIYKVNNKVEFGLRVYGHQYPAQENNCFDTRREVMFSKDNATQMALRMESMKPSGVSPMAYALKTAAAEDLNDEYRNAYSIILVTDGGESCGGNVCEVAQELIYRKIFFKSYLINLNSNIKDYSGYTCLGDNLFVTNDDDIRDAVKRIMSTYTPYLKEPIKIDAIPMVKPVDKDPKPQPPAESRTIVIPKSLHPSSTGNVISLTMTTRNNLPQMFHYNPVLRPLNLKEAPMRKIEREPETDVVPLPPTVKITPVTTTPVDPKPVIAAPKAVAMQPVKKDPEPVAIVPPAAPAPAQPAKDTTKTKVVIKALPPVGGKITPIKPADNKPKEVPFTASSEDAAETTVQIYFTDGHGKFYKTTPKLQLTNAKGEVVKQFYRTIDANGNPDPQPLPAGTYSLMLPGSSKTYLKNIVINPNKKNKYVAVVSTGSIRFRYVGAPDRPVSEFDALVNILFEPGPTVKQRCTAELEYAPGNYHIEINSLPIKKYNVDVDFGNTSELPVPQPGFVQFTNTKPIGRVKLYYQLGDQFVTFYGMELNGTLEAQKLQLLPGPYEVHWIKNAGMPFGSEIVQRFQIRANSITEIELH